MFIEDFIKNIEKLGFKSVDKFGKYKFNNYNIKIQLPSYFSRYTSIYFSHQKSHGKVWDSKIFNDYSKALEFISTKFQ